MTGFSVSLSLKTDPPSLCKIRRTPFSALIKCECMAKRLKVYRCIFDRRYDLEQVSSRLFSPVFYKVKVVESAGPQIHWSPTVLTVATRQCCGIIMDVNLGMGHKPPAVVQIRFRVICTVLIIRGCCQTHLVTHYANTPCDSAGKPWGHRRHLAKAIR